MAGKQVNNLAGRKSDRGRRPEKEWQIIGINSEHSVRRNWEKIIAIMGEVDRQYGGS